MHRALHHPLCTGLLVTGCAWPAAASASKNTVPQQRTAAQLAKDLSAFRSQVQTAGRAYDNALHALENTGSRIKSTDRRITAESDRRAAAEARLGGRVAAMYRTNEAATVTTFLLGATTFDDFITRADLIEMIGERDAALIKEVKDTRARLEASRRALVQDRSSQAAELIVFKNKRNALNNELGAVQAKYALLLGQLAAAMAREKAAGPMTWAPKGPNGVCFPWRGAN